MRFLPWHLNFFQRYRFLPEEAYGERAREHPLLQSRLEPEAFESSLGRLLSDSRPDVHRRLAEVLLGAGSRDEALEQAVTLAQDTPADESADAGDAGIREVAG
jgi:hypothetical protein